MHDVRARRSRRRSPGRPRGCAAPRCAPESSARLGVARHARRRVAGARTPGPARPPGTQHGGEVLHVDARAAVDVRRVFASEKVDAHTRTVVRSRPQRPRVTGMAASKVLAIVLAGGEGKRLMPLTADRAKPAVPFGGVYRLVDFALSNLVNARYLQDRGADPVQVAQPRPAHLAGLADVHPAGQLHRPGAGAAAGRQALVSRQRRRDLPEPQPRPGRAAGHHRRGRRRPRVPDGLRARWCAPTSTPGRPARWRRSGSRSAWPTSSA